MNSGPCNRVEGWRLWVVDVSTRNAQARIQANSKHATPMAKRKPSTSTLLDLAQQNHAPARANMGTNKNKSPMASTPGSCIHHIAPRSVKDKASRVNTARHNAH